MPCTTELPWISDVWQKDGNCLGFRTKTEGDLTTVTTHTQWDRDIRDTMPAGIKIYTVLLEFIEISKTKTAECRGVTSIIEKFRKENFDKIPSLFQMGAIKDISRLGDYFKARLPSLQKRYDYAIIIFRLRDTADAALEIGLVFRIKRCVCSIYSPGIR